MTPKAENSYKSKCYKCPCNYQTLVVINCG